MLGDDKKNMTVDEFDLLVRSIHRAYMQDPTCISFTGKSVYYKFSSMNKDRVSIFISNSVIWPTVQEIEFNVERPWFWAFKVREKLDNALQILEDISKGTCPPVATEQLICECIPLAKDIIAEKALVGDHGNKTSNNPT